MPLPTKRFLVALVIVLLLAAPAALATGADTALTYLPALQNDSTRRLYAPLSLLMPTDTPTPTETPTETPSPTPTDTFTPTPKGPPPGWINMDTGSVAWIETDPHDLSRVYASIWEKGIAVSADGGQYWVMHNDGLPTLSVNILKADPNTPGTVYAGTYRFGVYRSTDYGLSWQPLNRGMQAQSIVYALAIDPVNPLRLYAGTRGISNNGAAPWNGEVYKTTDGGQNWYRVLKEVGGADQQDWIYSIAVNPDPAHRNIVLAASHEHGPYLSTDWGETWTSVAHGMADQAGRSVAIDPRYTSPMAAYFATWHRTGVYKTADTAASWTLSPVDGLKVYSLTLDEITPDRVFLSTYSHGVLKSTNAGASWAGSGLSNELVYNIAIDRADRQRIYCGVASNGLFVSSDGGASWGRSLRGVSAGTITGMYPLGAGGEWIAAVYGSGIRTGASGAWQDLPLPESARYVSALVPDPNEPGRFFALTEAGDLLRIGAQGGAMMDLPLPASMRVSAPYLPAADESHPFASREALLGEQNVLPESLMTSGRAPLLALAFAPSDPGTAYLGTSGEGVLRSTDGGATWEGAGLAGETAWALAVDPASPGTVYAAGRAPLGGVVFRARDGGATWERITAPTPVYALAFSGGALYAGTGGGLLRLAEDGFVPAGLEGITVTVLQAHGGWLYAGTVKGAFQSPDSGLSWLPGPAELDGAIIRSISTEGGQVIYGTQWIGAFFDPRNP